MEFSAAGLRALLVVAAIASTLLAAVIAGFRTPAGAEAELVRVLQFLTLVKALLGAGALWLVGLRFGFPITPGRAIGYIAGAAIMASGPGAMWSTAHVILGSALFYAGVGVMLVIAWRDGGARWRFGSARPGGR
jgi:hypothetical protein